jgi:methionyl-tRNA formyltransferase
MKTILVTSAVTFVPNNYRGFWEKALRHPRVGALIVLDNRTPDLKWKAGLLVASLAAPRMGLQILKNFTEQSLQEKKSLCEQQGKKFFILPRLSSASGIEILKQLQPELLINARTREIFSKEVLSLPTRGCWNIHHGLLPDQRGLMCDFWAHLQDAECGFTIHEMTEKLDAGRILAAQAVPKNSISYLDYVETAANLEGDLIYEKLNRLEQNLPLIENIRSSQTIYRRNPKLQDFYKLNFVKGIRI